MQGSSRTDSVPVFKTILHGVGMLLMFALLAVDQSPLLAVIYDWLQVIQQALLSAF